jgi:hypothetical protein
MPTTGIAKIKSLRNPSNLRGVYVVEISSHEAQKIVDVVKEKKNASVIVDCIRFYDFTHARALTILDKIDDDHFGNALHTHNLKDQLLLCTWIYNGNNATETIRQKEDFGVCWAVVSYV